MRCSRDELSEWGILSVVFCRGIEMEMEEGA
jgi:hypothetical protein